MKVYKESTINGLYMTLRNKALRNNKDFVTIADLFKEFEEMKQKRFMKLDEVKPTKK